MESIKFREASGQKEREAGYRVCSLSVSETVWKGVDEIARRTRLTKREIANQLLTFALNHVEWED